ncbi:WxL domain-containing protein [Paenibacillus apiarius]|uniref:WxL domain-containing protein n=1 Tax=Paenibacillus apiarius TaxID=46240 RepID=UPI0019803428|nr:WxL domain-containing protein [Paenibacillus apiarius]MBN3526617.1 WxL domain-containing protein [Paenibacillus apiarius]
MKVIKVLALGIILAGTSPLSYSVKAADTDVATSTNSIRFTADDGQTNPVDPEDPDNPSPGTPVDPEDSGNGGTGNSGALTLDYVSNIQFGTQKIGSGTIAYYAKNKNPFVQVTDKRGTGEGWSLKARATEFKSRDGKVLAGAVLSFRNGQVKSQSGNVSAPPAAYDVVFDNKDAQLVMVAGNGAGRGTWIDVFSGTDGNNGNVQLQVLAGSADALTDYSAVITWVLSNAPS